MHHGLYLYAWNRMILSKPIQIPNNKSPNTKYSICAPYGIVEKKKGYQRVNSLNFNINLTASSRQHCRNFYN